MNETHDAVGAAGYVKPPPSHDTDAFVAGALTNLISGTLLASSLMAVLGEKLWEQPGLITIRLVSALTVFWLTHAYAGWLAEALTSRRPAARGSIKHELLVSSPIVLIAAPLLAPILLARTGIYTTDTGIWISYAEAIALLCGCGLLVGRRRDRGPRHTASLILVSGVLALTLIALKILVH